MTTTGWLGEEPEETHAAGFAEFILAHRAEPGAGRTLEETLARAAQADDRRGREEPADPDDRMAALVTRGYRPGVSWELSQKLADTMAELEAEHDKIERGQRRAEAVRRAHEAGQIRAWDIPAALGDEGDPGRVAQLERRAESLRRQIGDTQAMMAPPQARDPDPLEQATSRAHQAFVEATRARMAAAGTGVRARRPFGGRGVLAVRADAEVTCRECIKAGATVEESFLIHHEPDPLSVYGEPLVPPV
jgi:hypothetical protein